MNEGIRNADRGNVPSHCVTVTVLVIWHVGELFWERERAMSKNKGKGRGLEWLGYKCSSQTLQTMNKSLYLSPLCQLAYMPGKKEAAFINCRVYRMMKILYSFTSKHLNTVLLIPQKVYVKAYKKICKVYNKKIKSEDIN